MNFKGKEVIKLFQDYKNKWKTALFQASTAMQISFALFCDFMQCTHIPGQPIRPIFKDQAVKQDCLTLEDGTNRLSWNVSQELPLCAA